MSIYNLISKHHSHRAPGIYGCVVTGHFLYIVTNALSPGPEYEDNYLLISWLLPGARLKIIIFLWVHYLQRVFQLPAWCTAVQGKRKGWQIEERGEIRDFSHFLSWYQISPAVPGPGTSTIRCHSGLTYHWLVVVRVIRTVLTALWSSSLLSSYHYHYHHYQYHCPQSTAFQINN